MQIYFLGKKLNSRFGSPLLNYVLMLTPRYPSTINIGLILMLIRELFAIRQNHSKCVYVCVKILSWKNN